MITSQLLKSKEEQQLFSKETIRLQPRQRLELLLKAEKYPMVKKRTSAEQQIKEMIDFYNLCCLMLTQYFPNEKAESNFIILSFIESHENTQSIIDEEILEKFKLLWEYEKLENKIIAMQRLFYQYKYSFPELYETYNLEDISTESISEIIKETKQLAVEDSEIVKKTLKHWGLIS